MKTAVVYHRIDLDGWMSAAIVKHWFNTNEREAVFTEGDTTYSEKRVNQMTFIGYHYGDPIPNLNEYDRVVMCDISFPKEEMNKLYNTKDFIWLDHHISAIKDNNPHIKGIRDVKYAGCELTWDYLFSEPIPEIVRLLGRYDCFGHKNTPEETKVLEFQYGARQKINNYEEAYSFLIRSLQGNDSNGNSIEHAIWKVGVSIYQYLCTEAKNDIKVAFPISIHLKVNRTGQIDGYGNIPMTQLVELKFLAINKSRFNPINFGINYHEMGYDGFACFWFDGKTWQWSLYSDDNKTDVSIIAKALGGGGHKGAAGFRQDTLDFNFGLNL